MKSRTNLFSLVTAAAAALCLAFSPIASADGPKAVKVMTWNLFYGFDDGPVIAAAMSGDPELIAGAATTAWGEVHATDFHKRVRDIALRIRLEEPDLVGVQEAVRYVQVGPTGSIVETLDHLEILVAALREVGLKYEVVSSVDTLAVDLPVLDAEGNLTMVSIQDRSAVLSRKGHEESRSRTRSTASTSTSSARRTSRSLSRRAGRPSTSTASGAASASSRRTSRTPRRIRAVLPLQQAQALELVNVHLASGMPVVFIGRLQHGRLPQVAHVQIADPGSRADGRVDGRERPGARPHVGPVAGSPEPLPAPHAAARPRPLLGAVPREGRRRRRREAPRPDPGRHVAVRPRRRRRDARSREAAQSQAGVRPTTRPSTRSMRSAAGAAGSPGIRRMSPRIGTR